MWQAVLLFIAIVKGIMNAQALARGIGQLLSLLVALIIMRRLQAQVVDMEEMEAIVAGRVLMCPHRN